MKVINLLIRKGSFLLWIVLFALGYIGFAYYTTHVVMSDAYVNYLANSVGLVNYGVVTYLMDNFRFFTIFLFAVSGVMGLLLWLMRQGLIRISDRLDDRQNLARFSTLSSLLMDFLIAVGFVFLMGIKDNFFEMYYVLFESGLTEVDIAVHRMAYDIEMNWIFCQLLILKMAFDFIFRESSVEAAFRRLKEKKASAAAAVSTGDPEL
ncbi:MAG: hypothetical protein IJD21_07025 [Oscillospiraceae bacterium]|nr:hypothetical protein [Oscillospiraceae bacterium]